MIGWPLTVAATPVGAGSAGGAAGFSWATAGKLVKPSSPATNQARFALCMSSLLNPIVWVVGTTWTGHRDRQHPPRGGGPETKLADSSECAARRRDESAREPRVATRGLDDGPCPPSYNDDNSDPPLEEQLPCPGSGITS